MLRASTLVILAVTLAACGGVTPPAPPAKPSFARRPLPADLATRKAIAYSGYRAGQSPDLQSYPTEDQIADDLALLLRGGWGAIRMFDCGPHAERVLSVIDAKHLDLEVVQGVWIAGPRADHDAANQAEIARCLDLMQRHGAHVIALSVGNETLDDWSNVRTPVADLVAYIAQVRARVTVPVTTDDSFQPFLLGTDGATSYADVIDVARAIDFLSIHVYAFSDAFYDTWDWKQAAVPEPRRARAMMDAAILHTKTAVRDVRATMAARGLAMPIIIGETGWKSATHYTLADPPEHAIEVYLAHPVNQRMFLDGVDAWARGGDDTDAIERPVATFTFEAFDEPWKGQSGDDGWGLFDVARAPKLVLRTPFADLVPADAPGYVDGDAVRFHP